MRWLKNGALLFFDYYKSNIHPDIMSIARWAIEPYGVYDPYSGVTNNQAEGLNYVLKQLQEWKEAPVDCMLLALHYLQGYYQVEIARGHQGLGNYHLHPQFSTLLTTPPLLISEENVYCPEKIVEQIKESLNPPSAVEPTVPSTSTSKPARQHLSQHERARRVLNENQISVDLKLHTFTVMGSTCPHVVTLFPKETCSCPSTTQCYHILAAKISIGQHSEDIKIKINKKTDKLLTASKELLFLKSKRPRTGDCDVTAAPDAATKLKEPKLATDDAEYNKAAKKRLLAKVCVAHSSAGNFELLLKSYSSVTSISCMLCVYKKCRNHSS